MAGVVVVGLPWIRTATTGACWQPARLLTETACCPALLGTGLMGSQQRARWSARPPTPPVSGTTTECHWINWISCCSASIRASRVRGSSRQPAGASASDGIATTTAVRYLEYILIHVYIEIQLYYYLDYIYSQKSTQRAL